MANDVDLTALAKRTELFSGSDLKRMHHSSDFSHKPFLIYIWSTDLCVSAALDAVKEGVTLPWTTPKVEVTEVKVDLTDGENRQTQEASTEKANDNSPAASEEKGQSPEQDAAPEGSPIPRVLHLRHFDKALKEITPSSSESLGSLSALRKWNEEFGEGQKKKRKIMWGKGLFGFAETNTNNPLEGHVSAP